MLLHSIIYAHWNVHYDGMKDHVAEYDPKKYLFIYVTRSDGRVVTQRLKNIKSECYLSREC